MLVLHNLVIMKCPDIVSMACSDMLALILSLLHSHNQGSEEGGVRDNSMGPGNPLSWNLCHG